MGLIDYHFNLDFQSLPEAPSLLQVDESNKKLLLYIENFML